MWFTSVCGRWALRSGSELDMSVEPNSWGKKKRSQLNKYVVGAAMERMP